jgi:L-alanine-DL-glutamate epimerase-like enolase superfamily enzyme
VTITSLEAIPLAYPEPNDNGATRYIVIVRLVTGDGVVGWGESITQWPEASRATVEIVKGLAELVVGRSEVDVGGVGGSPRMRSRRSTSPCGMRRGRPWA